MRAPVRYWGRKAGDALKTVATELLSRLRPPALIIDPFAGAGSIGQYLIRLGYRVTLMDVNLYAWLISRVLIGSVYMPSSRFWSLFESLPLRIVNSKGARVIIPWKKAFSIKCGSGYDIILRRDCDEKEKICIAYTISGCKTVVGYDDGVIDVLDYYPRIPLQYPNGVVFEKRRNKQYVHEFFSPLMLAGMAAIARLLKIRKYSIKGPVGSLLWLALAAIAYNSSKMGRKGAGAWAINSYWIPRKHSEYNPFLRYRERVALILRYSLQRRVSSNPHRLRNLRWNNTYDALILWEDVRRLTKLAKPELFDAIITDPPHYDEIQYYELSYFHIAWLLPALNNSERLKALESYKYEIIVNRNRGVSTNEYLRMLRDAFQVLAWSTKRGAPLILFLHEENHRRLRSIIDSVCEAGFRILDETQIEMKTKPIGSKSASSQSDKITVVIGRREFT